MSIRTARIVVCALALAAGIALSPLAGRAQGLSLIRDSEIENIIRSYTTPLFQAAGLSADAIDVHIVNDDQINAFVAGGMNLFINTGLLMASEDPGEVIGVLAHETGHIAGGHLARTREAVRNASAEQILAYILGAAAVVAGQGEAGQAIIVGGTGLAQQSIIRYSQAQEQAADQAAVRYLDATGQSAEGLLDMFRRLEDQELLVAERQDPYVRSHPLTRERIRFIKNHVANSAFSGGEEQTARLAAHHRMVAKLTAFLKAPNRVLKLYPESDTSVPARYARAIAYYRIPELDRALAEIDGLIADDPDDPWFHELKGQILFENGRIADAIAPYERAVGLKPKEGLLRLGLARAQLETGDLGLNREAIENLKIATKVEPRHAPYWRFLGIAYARDEQVALSSLAFAEDAILRGKLPEARHHAERAKEGLPEGSPSWLRAEDISAAADAAKEDEER